MSTPADTVKARIRADLTRAMKARDSAQASLLRVLLAALDNAEAVPIGAAHEPYKERAFGDPSAEVPRLVLSAEEVTALVAREQAEREAAAAHFERLGLPGEAGRLRQEASWVAQYR